LEAPSQSRSCDTFLRIKITIQPISQLLEKYQRKWQN